MKNYIKLPIAGSLDSNNITLTGDSKNYLFVGSQNESLFTINNQDEIKIESALTFEDIFEDEAQITEFNNFIFSNKNIFHQNSQNNNWIYLKKDDYDKIEQISEHNDFKKILDIIEEVFGIGLAILSKKVSLTFAVCCIPALINMDHPELAPSMPLSNDVLTLNEISIPISGSTAIGDLSIYNAEIN